jgi:hypothetical protein
MIDSVCSAKFSKTAYQETRLNMNMLQHLPVVPLVKQTVKTSSGLPGWKLKKQIK